MNSSDWKVLWDEEPDNELLQFSYAKALMDEREWLKAAHEFEKLLSIQTDYVIAWAFLARSRLEAGEVEKAREAALKGLPLALKFNHEVPIEELEAVIAELDSEF